MFLRVFSIGLVLACAVGLFPNATEGPNQANSEREGEGVWQKERCITPSAHMPIVAFVPPSAYQGHALQPAIDTARSYRGAVEKPPGSNAGTEVERFLASVGLGPGYAWCAAFASHSLQQGHVAPINSDGQEIRSAGAQKYRDAKRTLSPRDVATGRKTAPAGSLVVWAVRGSWKGHIGMVVRDWRGRCGLTVEGNTTPP